MMPQANPRGDLLQIREAAARGRMHQETLRRYLLKGRGPPAFKRPGSNRWFFWSRMFDEWLDGGPSSRRPERDDVAAK